MSGATISKYQSVLLIFLSVFLISSVKRKKILQFPNQHLGVWQGKGLVIKGRDTTFRFEMKIEIKAIVFDSLYQFNLNYSGQKVRNYTLVCTDKIHNYWAIDEGAGLVLDGYFLDNKLVDFFKVNQQFIRTEYLFTARKIEVWIDTWDERKMRETYTDTVSKLNILSCKPGSVQKVVLKKLK